MHTTLSLSSYFSLLLVTQTPNNKKKHFQKTVDKIKRQRVASKYIRMYCRIFVFCIRTWNVYTELSRDVTFDLAERKLFSEIQ